MKRDPRQSRNGDLFSGVVCRVFPLRADPSTLQGLVDSYLNHPEIIDENYFRAANSYVFFQVLNYARMSDDLSRLGYLSQHEVTFSIPLHWYRRSDEGLSEWQGRRYELVKGVDTLTTPFIFVDNDLSLIGGRELYGWPKTKMTVSNTPNEWLSHPEKKSNVLSMHVSVYTEMFKDRGREDVRLIDVTEERGFALGTGSDQLRRMYNPFREIYETGLEIADISEHMALHQELWLQSFMSQFDGRHPEREARALQSALTDQERYQLASLGPLPGRVSNNIGVKQFRDSMHPDRTVYQSIGNSQMVTEFVRGMGQLGRFSQQATDMTGGFRVLIRDYEQIPIVSQLGLICDEVDTGLFEVKPVQPFWLDVDLRYRGAVETLITEVHGDIVHVDPNNLPAYETEYEVLAAMEGEA